MQNKYQKALYPILLASVFIIASCGILYELLIGSLASYFLGNSILQFSLTIGLFMFFMGIGSYLSKFFTKKLFTTFVIVEIILGILGGISAFTLNYIYAYTLHFRMYSLIFIALPGILIGLEIPIVTRIIARYSSLKDTVAKVLSFDYVGALAASLIFPLLLLPKLGIIGTAFLIGFLNLGVASLNAFVFKAIIKYHKFLKFSALSLMILFLGGIYFSGKIERKLEQRVYQDKIIFSEDTQYQHLVMTRWKNDYRLYINGSIQFSSIDEYRYHESLVHLPMALVEEKEKILVLGGGDGMVVREILKYKDVKEIHLVDLDPRMTDLGKNNPIFQKLNKHSLEDPKVTIFNQDAFSFVENSKDIYSAVIIDLPDPNDTGLAKLYTKEFYELLKKRMSRFGVMVTQSTSPYFAPTAFWCIYHTVNQVFENPVAYNVNIPSFGIWGFTAAGGGIDFLAKNNASAQDTILKKAQNNLMKNLQFLDSAMLPATFIFNKDMRECPTEINTLNTQKLLQYYNKSAERWR